MTVTPLYAGILAILYLVLSFRVVMRRRAGRINLGDGGDVEMQRRIRGHGNFAEYVPFVLLLMALIEIGGVTSTWLLHTLGIMLVVGRVLHAYALSFSAHFFIGRFLGTILTFLALLVAGLLCLWRGLASTILAMT